MQVGTKAITKIFNKNTPLEIKAINEISTVFKRGELVAIIGATGSGKTTFVEHLNCLLIPDSGYTFFENFPLEIKISKKNIKEFEQNLIFLNLEEISFTKLLTQKLSHRSNKKIIFFNIFNLLNNIFNFAESLEKIRQNNENFKNIWDELCFLFNFSEKNFYELFQKYKDKDIFLKKKVLLFSLLFLKPRKLIINKNELKSKKLKEFLKEINDFYPQVIYFFNKNINLKKIIKNCLKEETKKIFQNIQIKKGFYDTKMLKYVRKKIGIVFQFSEHQLFKTTVEEDIIFGPLAMGISKKRAKYLARKYIKLVGLDNSFLNHSPFDLSGGQKRRVSIAGILAMEPDFLIFDEPTAGLDPAGAKLILDILRKLNQAGKTIIICTHDLDNVLMWAQRILFFKDGALLKDGDTYQILKNKKFLEDNKMEGTRLLNLVNDIERKCNIKVGEVRNIEQLAERINTIVKEKGKSGFCYK